MVASGTDSCAPPAWVSSAPGMGLSLAAVGAVLGEHARDAAPVLAAVCGDYFSASVRGFKASFLSAKKQYNQAFGAG